MFILEQSQPKVKATGKARENSAKVDTVEKYKFTFIEEKRLCVEVEASTGIEAELLARNLLNEGNAHAHKLEAKQKIQFVESCGFDALTGTEWVYWRDKI